MSSLRPSDKSKFEDLLGMSSGYVLNFSDASFGTFIADIDDIDIHSDKYSKMGTSKAKRLRTFWNDEPDAIVGKVLLALVERWHESSDPDPKRSELYNQCYDLACRLVAGGPRLTDLKHQAAALDARHLSEQIRRIEDSIEKDPPLAIGMAKELIETCCKTILAERGMPVEGTPDVPALTKQTLKELKLLPDGIPNEAKGADAIKRMLSNLATVTNGLAELRNLYGTGHGKDGKTPPIKSRHAKLAVGAAVTLATFLFETHKEAKP